MLRLKNRTKFLLLALLLPALAYGGQPTNGKLVDNLSISVSIGTREFGPAAVPDGLTIISITLNRRTQGRPTTWDDPAIKVTGEILLSLNQGKSFALICGFTAEGGTDTRPDGSESPVTSVVCPMPLSNNRQAKAVLTVSGAQLVTNITVEAK